MTGILTSVNLIKQHQMRHQEQENFTSPRGDICAVQKQFRLLRAHTVTVCLNFDTDIYIWLQPLSTKGSGVWFSLTEWYALLNQADRIQANVDTVQHHA